jgi:uncharacterized membrane protein YvbJ
MFCSKCGAEILDEAVICPKCGCKTGVEKLQEKEVDEPKTGMGILLGLFLGIIGLIIGLCLFKENTVARKTFIKSWAITFAVTVVIYIIVIAVYVSSINSMMKDLYDTSDLYNGYY